MPTKIASVLLELHRDCRRPTVEEFPRWACEVIKPAIAFDTGFWGSGCIADGELVAHCFWLYKLPPESMPAWERLKDVDTISPLLLARQNRVVSLANADLRERHAAIYQAFLSAYGIEQYLGTYAANEATGLFDVLAVYRANSATPFSEEERNAFECLVPHLVEARRANYLSRLSGGMVGTTRPYLAAADAAGILHAVEEGFAALMAQEWSGWRGPRLPAPLVARMAGGEDRCVGNEVTVEVRRALDMWLLSARPRQPVDDLSLRQIGIARSFADGLSHKEIARRADIAPATARNHLSTIYRTLGIGSKAELATLLARHGHFAAG